VTPDPAVHGAWRIDRGNRETDNGYSALMSASVPLPGREDSARLILGVQASKKGQIRMLPEVRWIPFTPELLVDSTHSSFPAAACLNPGKAVSPTVTDAYEQVHRRLAVKLASLAPVNRGARRQTAENGSALASIVFGPSIRLNHKTLRWSAPGRSPFELRIWGTPPALRSTSIFPMKDAPSPALPLAHA
jgi:hypothetical protein